VSELSPDDVHDVAAPRDAAPVDLPRQRTAPDEEAIPPRPRHPGLLVALLAVAVVAIGAIVVVFTARPACAAPGCATARPAVSSSPPATPSRSYGPPPAVPLARTMPDDLVLASCQTTRDEAVPLADVIAYYECAEKPGTQLPGLRVWGYQFRDATTYATGVRAFNAYAKYDRTRVAGDCPPTDRTGYRLWARDDRPGDRRGQLECYADPSAQPNYVWTDDTDLTLIVAAAPAASSFEELDAWWHRHNRSGSVQ
jgi:hypothetical protein